MDVSVAQTLLQDLLKGGWKSSEGQRGMITLVGTLLLQLVPSTGTSMLDIGIHLGVPLILGLTEAFYAHNRTKIKAAGVAGLTAFITAATAALNAPDAPAADPAKA